MSVESMANVLKNVDGGIPPAAKLILIGIANHEGDGGSWPSMATLARYAMVTQRRARELVRLLEERGYITREVQHGGTVKTVGGQRPNLYRVVFSPAHPVDNTPDEISRGAEISRGTPDEISRGPRLESSS